MFKNHFKTAWRNIFRNKTATLINLFGLSVSLVAFIFIALWVQNELSFDSYHKAAKDIYLVQTLYGTEKEASTLTALPVADAVNKISGTAKIARMAPSRVTLKVNGQLFDEKESVVVDSDWFKIFDYDVLSGDVQSFNNNTFSIIFTQSKARQLFGNKNPIGQFVHVDTSLYQVRAIVKDNPINSSFQFEMLMPMAARFAYRKPNPNDWANMSYRTFVKIYPATDVVAFAEHATAFSQQVSKRNTFSLQFQPLRDLHFDTKADDWMFRRGSHTAVYVFSVLAVLLLITASINYVNLTIAKANARTKEISIRKIMGGSRLQLFVQFLTESFLLCVLALAISLIIILLTLPLFNRLTETGFQLSLSSPLLWSILIGTLFSATMLIGVFPSLTLSLFKPLNYLHGYTILNFRSTAIRKTLVVFQFVVGIVLIIGTIVIFLQMRLAQSSAAQYNRSQVVSLSLPTKTLSKLGYDAGKIDLFSQTFRNELEKISSVQRAVVTSTSIEGNMNSSGAPNWYWKDQDTAYQDPVVRISIGPEGKDLFNFQMMEGRWFENGKGDEKNFVLNETAVKDLGIREPVIGQVFARVHGDTGHIIGVIKDYNFSSLYNKLGPMVISFIGHEDLPMTLFAKITPGNIPQAMGAIAATWKRLIPDAPFEYQFMDQAFDNLYKDDLRISELVLLFSCISIIISALGLFGLATFVAEQKTKEIGIRKVLGASVTQITVMLSRDFVTLVLIAVVIASPIAYWVMSRWLQNFAYKINLSWWIFGSAGIVAILIAVITISGRAIRAAIANPVNSLRTE
ncbi:MAG TPA: FtsX-like permease family protein [Puia sp.]|nr:FtsX-like permease family protein [Puia sp.]